MKKTLIGTLCLTLLFLIGCGQKVEKKPDDSAAWTTKAINIEKGDRIDKQDTINITGSIPEKTRYKKYRSVDLGISFSILAYQEDSLFQTKTETYVNVVRENHKISLTLQKQKGNITSIEVFHKPSEKDSATFIKEMFLTGKDKHCQIQEIEIGNQKQNTYKKWDISYRNMDKLRQCDTEFCSADMFCGPYAEGEKLAYFIGSETGNTLIFFKAGDEKIIGTSDQKPREETIQING